MGSWGVGLYSNDIGCDIRDDCAEIYPLLGEERGTAAILEEYRDIICGEPDNESANFWFALADWQWKHGILSPSVKETALSLIDARVGLDEWIESGTPTDVKKRIEVTEKLRAQLLSPQPQKKIPKPKIAKPKHKRGDIIIFRTCGKDFEYAETVWNIEHCTDRLTFAPDISDKVSSVLSPPYEAYGKYLAIICVGTEKELHSKYAPDIFDERSIYAFYDFISDEKPTLDDLGRCGFLPMHFRYSPDSPDSLSYGWKYTFSLYAYGFRISNRSSEKAIEKIFCADEAERFYGLLSKKDYCRESTSCMELFDAFSDFFEEKARLGAAGVAYDNLLDPRIKNPPLRSDKEFARAWREEVKREEEMIR